MDEGKKYGLKLRLIKKNECANVNFEEKSLCFTACENILLSSYYNGYLWVLFGFLSLAYTHFRSTDDVVYAIVLLYGCCCCLEIWILAAASKFYSNMLKSDMLTTHIWLF